MVDPWVWERLGNRWLLRGRRGLLELWALTTPLGEEEKELAVEAEEEQEQAQNEQQVNPGNPGFQQGGSLAKVPAGASVTLLEPLD